MTAKKTTLRGILAENERLRRRISGLESARIFHESLAHESNIGRSSLNALDAMQDGVIIIGAENHLILYANTSASHILGIDRSDLIGNVCHQFICPNARGNCPFDDPRQRFRHAESVLLRRDGKEIPVLKTVRRCEFDGSACLLENFTDISGHRRLQRNLLWERQFSDTAINSLPGLFYMIDHNGKMLRWNKNVEKVTGYSPETISEMLPQQFFVPEHRRIVTEAISQVFRSGTADVEADLLLRDGSRAAYYFIASRSHIGEIPCLIGEAMDIRTVKTMENNLRQANDSLAEIIEHSSDGIVIADTEGIIRYMNATAKVFLSYRSDIAPGGRINMAQFRQGRELSINRKNGLSGIAEIAERQLQWQDHSCRLFSLQDVSERKGAQQQARHLFATMRLVLETMPFGVYMINNSGKVEYVNPAMLRISGDEYEQFMSINVFELPTYKKSGLAGFLHRAFDQPRMSLKSVEYTSFFGNKRSIRNFTGVPVEEGGERKMLIFVEDITDKIETERQQKEMLEMKSRFVSMVSHELRTPLTAIKEGIAMVLEEMTGPINEEQQELLALAKRNVDRLARLINDVLNFQRLDAGKVSFDLKTNDMLEIISEVSATMANLAREKGLYLRLQSRRRALPVVCDRDKIIQVLTNLVHNAIKFTETGGVTIHGTLRNRSIVVTVEDTGNGISPEDQKKLFHQFVQLGIGGKRIPGGTGLGLSICKQILLQHGGTIRVKSKVGTGSRFIFSLPIERSNHAEDHCTG